MLTIANQGGEGVKKHEKHANVICERPPSSSMYSHTYLHLIFSCEKMKSTVIFASK